MPSAPEGGDSAFCLSASPGILPLRPDYRRSRVPGGKSFFAMNLLDRRSDLSVIQIDASCAAVRQVCARFPFSIDACVVFRDHMHSPWT